MLQLHRRNVAAIPLFDSLQTAGGLWIPEQARERCDQGIVKYIGKDVKEVSEGDHILFSGYSGTLLDLEGEGTLIILPERYVVAKIAYDGPEVANIDISGLYFRDSDGRYWNATYEFASRLISKGLEESKWFKRVTAWAWRADKKNKSKLGINEYNEPDEEDE